MTRRRAAGRDQGARPELTDQGERELDLPRPPTRMGDLDNGIKPLMGWLAPLQSGRD